MPKHSTEDNEGSDFWKRMRYGAAAAVTLGSGIYAAASVLKKQGLIGDLVDDVKVAMHAAPQLLQPGRVPDLRMHSADDEETRAVLNMQLQFAMQRQDMQRVQDISRQLDQLDEGRVHGSPHNGKRKELNPQSEAGMRSQTLALMRAPASKEMRMPMGMETYLSAEGAKMVTSPSGDTQVRKPAPNPLSVSGKPEVTAQLSHDGAKKGVESQLTPRKLAMLQLEGGDIVEALDPVTGQWSAAIVHSIAKNGLIQVRWDDPGADAKGRPFHPIGEVWAEQIQMKRRASPSITMSGESPVNGDDVTTPPDGLQIGDDCFAAGTVLEKKWFHAKLIGVRSRSPPMRIEYISTLDGQTNELLLPSPRKDYVHVEQICRRKPEPTPEAPQVRRGAHNERADEKKDEEMQGAKGADGDEFVITPDLKCIVCERPDDEANMLVCDCKRGYHTYCLNPQLDGVPEGDWHCPRCAQVQ